MSRQPTPCEVSRSQRKAWGVLRPYALLLFSAHHRLNSICGAPEFIPFIAHLPGARGRWYASLPEGPAGQIQRRVSRTTLQNHSLCTARPLVHVATPYCTRCCCFSQCWWRCRQRGSSRGAMAPSSCRSGCGTSWSWPEPSAASSRGS